MEKKLEIHSMMALSTAHISLETKNQLEHEQINGLVVYQKEEFGWFVVVPDEEEEPEHLPDDLKNLIMFAKQNECSWIMLDRDVQIISVIPTFNW